MALLLIDHKSNDLVEKAQSMRNAAKATIDGLPDNSAKSAALADLHKMVGAVQVAREAAIGMVCAAQANAGNSPIEVYNGLKGTFGDRLPEFSVWVKKA